MNCCIRFATACKRVILVTFLVIALWPTLAFPGELQKPEWAINANGEVFRIFDLMPTTIQALRIFPEHGERTELLANQALTFSLPQEYGAKTEDVVDAQTLEAYFVAGRFPDGRIFLNTFGSRGSRLIPNNESIFPAMILRHREVRQEDGRIVTVLAKLEDGRFLTADPPRTLIRGTLIPTRTEQTETARSEIFKFPKLQSYFEYFHEGGAVDLDNQDERILFHIYLAARLDSQFNGDFLTGDLLPKVADFIRTHEIPKKPGWSVVQIRTRAGRTLRLRPLSREEAVFRGCLGKDCSTRTRPLRALEPAHVYFAIEEVPYRALGQIELVLGTVYNERGIFLERIQSPKNLRPYELAGLIDGLVQVFERHRIGFFTLESIGAYSRGGHPLSNYRGLEERLNIALANHFEMDPMGVEFKRDSDVFPQVDESHPHNLVAHLAAQRSMPFRRLRTQSLPSEILELNWIEPKVPKKIKFPSQQQLRDELEEFIEPIKSKNPYVTNLVWRSVLNYLWFNCEYYLD